MKKLYVICLAFFVSACIQYNSIEKYKLEKLPGYEMPVCVNYSKVVRERPTWIDIGGEDRHRIEGDDSIDSFSRQIVSYSYCLERLPKQVHLVEKKKNDMTICYDRNNKVELPILYCQKDMNIRVYQEVSVR